MTIGQVCVLIAVICGGLMLAGGLVLLAYMTDKGGEK
jgi:hypothetical protein